MRKSNSIKNFITSIIPFGILVLLGFIRINVFIKELGIEIYAVNQLFFQLFAYISLVEAGVGTLIQQQYYKYLANMNKNKILAIYNKSKKILKKISIIILILGFIVSFFLKFLTNNNLTLWYMQLIFMIFLFRSVLEYLMFSPRLLLQADQKIYKINIKLNVYRIIEYIIEIILLYLGGSYIYILISSIIIRYISYYFINKKIFIEYPWLNKNQEYEDIEITGIKNILYHKISGAVYSNTDILLVSAFLSPLMVTIYSSYNYIIKFINDSISILSGSIISSFGNVIYKENDRDKLIIFEELNILFLFCATFFSIVLYFSINNFVSLWIGPDKTINNIALIFMLIVMFHGIARKPLLIIKDANGLFKETQLIAIMEAIIKLVLSIVLIKYYNLNGVLFATILSTIFTNFWFYPNYMYKNVLKSKPVNYYAKYFISLFLVISICFISKKTLNFLIVDNYLKWFTYSAIYSLT
ncbi:MAG: hypothetical protein PHG18_03460, partial [Bacilli bacterium]|nr:hypothetical protein [Bacilli bacterium]